MSIIKIFALALALACTQVQAQNKSNGVAAAITGAAITYGVLEIMKDRTLGNSAVVYKAQEQITPADTLKIKAAAQESCPPRDSLFGATKKVTPVVPTLGDLFATATRDQPARKRDLVQVTQTPVGDRGCSIYTFHYVEK